MTPHRAGRTPPDARSSDAHHPEPAVPELARRVHVRPGSGARFLRGRVTTSLPSSSLPDPRAAPSMSSIVRYPGNETAVRCRRGRGADARMHGRARVTSVRCAAAMAWCSEWRATGGNARRRSRANRWWWNAGECSLRAIPELRRLLDRTRLAGLGMVDPAVRREALDAFERGTAHRFQPEELLSVAHVEAWLRAHGPISSDMGHDRAPPLPNTCGRFGRRRVGTSARREPFRRVAHVRDS
jgi:hypothetical protein